MRVCLPYSKKKRYLTGMDWVIAALDHMSRKHTGGSNASQIVLELQGPFDDARFTAGVADFVKLLPVIGGRAARDWNLAPYWKIPRAGGARPVKVEIRTVAEAALRSALAQSINTPFADPHEHLAFRVFHVRADRHYLAMRFDHCILDAQGAEALLDLFHCWQQGDDCRERLAKIALIEPAHLSDWMKKFDDGRQLVRMLRELVQRPLAIIPRPSPLKGRNFCFSLIEFNEQETRSIIERADREAGFMMFMPYVLATAVTALDGVFRARTAEGRAGQEYVMSVSINLRTPDTASAKLFFNHMSFLVFRVPTSIAGDRKQVIEILRLQMYEQIKNGFPQALAESSMLMRILPLPLLSWVLLRPLKGEFASFGFSSVGKNGYRFSRFMGAEVVNLLHMPLVPLPPGLGFVVNQFGKRMNATLSYVDGLLSPEEVNAVEAIVRRLP